MMGEFIEAMQSGCHDPMDAQRVDFPFDALDGEDQGEGFDRGAFLSGFLTWLRGNPADFTPAANVKARMRLDAVLWTLRPSYFPGSPSLTKLAARMRVDESVLSRIVSEVTRMFGIHNRAQAHGDGVRK